MMARGASPLTAAVKAAVGYGLRLLFTNSQTAMTSRWVAPTAAATSRKRRSPRSARCSPTTASACGGTSISPCSRRYSIWASNDSVIEREPMPIGSSPFIASSTCSTSATRTPVARRDLGVGLGQEAVRVERADDVVGDLMER